MAWRMHPRGAHTDPSAPRAFATCDDCGFIFNHYKLSWQFDWAGTQLINKRFLKCPRCLDVPQEQFRTIIIPPDPPPIYNARPEPYAIDEGLVAAFTGSIAPGTPSGGALGPLSGAILTVTAIASGRMGTGAQINGPLVKAGTVLVDQLTFVPAVPPIPGGLGTYAVSISQTVPSSNLTLSY